MTHTSAGCVALAAVTALLAGVSDAFVPSSSLRFSVSRATINNDHNLHRGCNSRPAGCLSMSVEGGTTRGKATLEGTLFPIQGCLTRSLSTVVECLNACFGFNLCVELLLLTLYGMYVRVTHVFSVKYMPSVSA